MHVHHEFPKWKYHRSEAARIVHDPAAEDGLGEGWADSPAVFLTEDEDATVLTEDEDEVATLSPDKSAGEASPMVNAPTKKKTRKG